MRIFLLSRLVPLRAPRGVRPCCHHQRPGLADSGCSSTVCRFALIVQTQKLYMSQETMNENNANGTASNWHIDSNDSPPGNNQQFCTA